ncbi:porin family protein [uncultured Dokdonia sp.]|uniref:porin family protein n=1 Tax=uncultured Dokdonia sp. TaxID=575653 RepID=UPI0026341415|nr:porin family protein [uncultured Dokdonia sp.]
MKYYLFLTTLFLTIGLMAQEEAISYEEEVDSLYREDQVYVGVTFNLLSNKPASFSQNGLSAGVQVGVIRDFPINKRRNKAIGVGIGLALDTYNQNLFIGEEMAGEVTNYEILDDQINEEVNRFTTYTLEFPLEYRWRTSTPTKYSFWRIHAGVKLGYLFRFKSTFQDASADIVRTDLPEINNFQYGPSFSFGYGAFNFQGYYGLSTLFNDDAQIDGDNVNLQVIRLGLVFYFL